MAKPPHLFALQLVSRAASLPRQADSLPLSLILAAGTERFQRHVFCFFSRMEKEGGMAID
jgi:hypothetical protein